VEPAIGFDNDHFTSAVTTSASHEQRYKSSKTENDLLKKHILR
jgi:hypothetical protein